MRSWFARPGEPQTDSATSAAEVAALTCTVGMDSAPTTRSPLAAATHRRVAMTGLVSPTCSSSSGADEDELWDTLRELPVSELVNLVKRAAITHTDVRGMVAEMVVERTEDDARCSDTESEPPEVSSESVAPPATPLLRAPPLSVSMHQLPQDILDVVFAKLPHSSLSRAACVCRAWRGAAAHRWSALHGALLARQAQEQRQQQQQQSAGAVAAPGAAAAGAVHQLQQQHPQQQQQQAPPAPGHPAGGAAFGGIAQALAAQVAAAAAAVGQAGAPGIAAPNAALGAAAQAQAQAAQAAQAVAALAAGWAANGVPGAAAAGAAAAAAAAVQRAVPVAPPPVASWQQFTALSYQQRLAFAVESRDEEQTRQLLEWGALPDATTDVGAGPVLWTAIRTSQRDLVAALVKAGARPLTPMDDGAYLFHCVNTGDVATASFLLEAGLPVDTMTRLCPHYFDNRWASAFVAAMESDPDLLEFLVRQGFEEGSLRTSYCYRLDATRQSATRCMTALQRACITGATELTRLLLKHGAMPGITAGGKDRTALHLAIRHLRPSNPALPEIVTLLLSAGADVHAPDASGNTPLGLLVKRGTVTTDAAEIRRVQRTIEAVLGSNACPNTNVFKGNGQAGVPALLAAVNHQHYGIARLLLQHGADVNVVDPRNGYTVLRKVVNRICEYPTLKPRARAFFEVLCKHPKLDCSLMAEDGLTPLQVALQRGLTEVVLELATLVNLPLDEVSTAAAAAAAAEAAARNPAAAAPARVATDSSQPGSDAGDSDGMGVDVEAGNSGSSS